MPDTVLPSCGMPTDRVELLSSTRPVLGLMLDAGFRSERLRLYPGDRLLLYTDGVTEAINDAGEEFGADRLARLLEYLPNGSLPEQYGNIMNSVRSYARRELRRRCYPHADLGVVRCVRCCFRILRTDTQQRLGIVSVFRSLTSVFDLKLET